MPSNDELREACETLLKSIDDWNSYKRTGLDVASATLLARHVKSTLATTTANTLQPGTDIFRDEKCSIVDIDSV